MHEQHARLWLAGVGVCFSVGIGTGVLEIDVIVGVGRWRVVQHGELGAPGAHLQQLGFVGERWMEKRAVGAAAIRVPAVPSFLLGHPEKAVGAMCISEVTACMHASAGLFEETSKTKNQKILLNS